MLPYKIFFAALFLSAVSIANAETKSIGLILPLSGGGASYGVSCKNGIELALENFKERIGNKFNVVYEDDQNVPTQTVSSLRKLKNTNKSQFILTFSSSTSNAISHLAERENFILFALASDPNVVKDKKNVFNYWVTPDEEVKAMFIELKRRNIKRIAIFATQHEGTLAARKAIEINLPGSGIEIIFDEEFTPDSRDFRTPLSKAAKLKALDGIFNILYIDQVGLLPKQARDLGIKVPVFNRELYESQAVVDSAQGALDGQFFVTAPVGIKEFGKTYSEKFPSDSLISAANCYDFIGLLATAPELTVDGFRKYLETLKDYPGAAGTSSSSGDHRFTLPAIIKEVRGNQFIALDR